MTQSIRNMPKQLPPSMQTVMCAISIVAFEIAYKLPAISLPAIVVFAGLVCRITSAASQRQAFYSGLVIGTVLAGLELNFFYKVFGAGAVGLWLILGVWLALFMLSAAKVQAAFPSRGIWLLPVLWIGFEYFRGELYYLRFTWVTPGLALVNSPFQDLLHVGQYGAGGLIVLCGVLLVKNWRAGLVMFASMCLFVVLFPAPTVEPGRKHPDGPVIAGIQLEFPAEHEVCGHLDAVLHQIPDADIMMLSEYTFDGPVTDAVLSWCDVNDRYLVAGGKEPIGDDDFRNTVFVCDPNGDIVHRQAKAVPIQFFSDGQPAEKQEVWNSPWGRVGIAICYDMSYTRVIDVLIDQGAQIILNPTMDPIEWGEDEHRLHSRIPVARAIEYGVPVFRLASSGISAFVESDGSIQADGTFPGQGDILRDHVEFPKQGRLPVDRWFVMICVISTPIIVAASVIFRHPTTSDSSLQISHATRSN